MTYRLFPCYPIALSSELFALVAIGCYFPYILGCAGEYLHLNSNSEITTIPLAIFAVVTTALTVFLFVHHLKKDEDSGLVRKIKKAYILCRGANFGFVAALTLLVVRKKESDWDLDKFFLILLLVCELVMTLYWTIQLARIYLSEDSAEGVKEEILYAEN